MTKTLTEQWKEGTLKEGWYYLSIVPSKKCIDYYYGKDFERYNEWAIEEVLAPVPSYDDWEELQEASDGLSKTMFKSLMDRFVKADEERERLEEESSEMVTKCNRLEEQLKEANEVIKFYANIDKLTEEEKQMTAEKYHLVYGLKANDYLEKWRLR